VEHLELLSLRDCGITDKIIIKCQTGLCNVRLLDLSGNPDISHVGWKTLADCLMEPGTTRRLGHLVYQSAKYMIDQQQAEQFAEMFPGLLRLDLSLGQLADESVRIFVAALAEQQDPEFSARLDRLDLSGCGLSEYSLQLLEEANRRRGADLIVFRAGQEVGAVRGKTIGRGCCLCCT